MKLASTNKLNSLEKPKQITLLMDPFTIESDLLTPTMKLKRNIAKDKFKEQINKMYESKPMVVTGAPVPKNVE
jgi:long-chain acyl-CoA synthetase